MPDKEEMDALRVAVILEFDVRIQNSQFLKEILEENLFPYVHYQGTDNKGRGRFHFAFSRKEVNIVEITEIQADEFNSPSNT